jgi:hypothetical protein
VSNVPLIMVSSGASGLPLAAPGADDGRRP